VVERTSRDGPRARRGRVATAALAMLIAAAAGCSGPADAGDVGDRAEGLVVAASFYPLAEAARRVGGDAVEVVDLTPSGVEPHDLELTPEHVETIRSADVVVFLGGGFQPGVEEAIDGAAGVVVDVLEGVPTIASPADGAEGEGPSVDPHIWLDPQRYAAVAARIAETLGRADPSGAPGFEQRADAFAGELASLDEAFASGLATCDHRRFVTTHAAFAYLAKAYDLDQLAIAGLEPEAEPTPDRLAELARIVREEDVTTIFTEELISPDAAETLAAEAGVETAVLNTLEGAPADGGDYGAAMRQNLDALRLALGCS
jgi:zinc transport system substrate-binding protein